MSAGSPKVGVVGCGATTQLNHLPALRALGMRAQVLVDREEARAEEVAGRFGAEHATGDLAEAAATLFACTEGPPAESEIGSTVVRDNSLSFNGLTSNSLSLNRLCWNTGSPGQAGAMAALK